VTQRCGTSAPSRSRAPSGILYDTQNIDLFKNEQFKPGYLKINPKASFRRSITMAASSSNQR
jgi:hypothetical protein